MNIRIVEPGINAGVIKFRGTWKINSRSLKARDGPDGDGFDGDDHLPVSGVFKAVEGTFLGFVRTAGGVPGLGRRAGDFSPFKKLPLAFPLA
ncbi:MAG: hypothetical protein V2I46_06370 [Bacteroides sp.]|jgi:hypothetical protein|nr:hypothetical protein [Bacteroides sp.]